MSSHVPNDQQCPHCGRFNNRGLSSEAIIVRDGKILLGKRKFEPYKGYWGTFGGFVEWDETTEQALARETKEEAGLTVTSAKLIGVYSDPKSDPRQPVCIAYAVQTTGEPQAGDDIEAVKWVPLDNLPEDLPFDHARIIADYLKIKTDTP